MDADHISLCLTCHRGRIDQQLMVSAISGSGCSCSYEMMTIHLVNTWEFFLEYPDFYDVWHKNNCFGCSMGHRMIPRVVVMYRTSSLRHSFNPQFFLTSLLFAIGWFSSVSCHGSCSSPLFTNRRSNWRQNRRATQVGNLYWYFSERHNKFLLFLCI